MFPESSRHIVLKFTVCKVSKNSLNLFKNANVVLLARFFHTILFFYIRLTLDKLKRKFYNNTKEQKKKNN